VLRKYLGLRELTGDWRRLRNKNIYGLHSSTNIFSGDEIDKNETGGELGTYGEKTGASGIWLGHLRERDYLGDLGIKIRIKLKWTY
jgi:hypothetical protein